jgi:hypothetical protein
MGAGDRLGHGGQGPISLTLVFESVGQDQHADGFSSILALHPFARRRQPRVAARIDPGSRGARIAARQLSGVSSIIHLAFRVSPSRSETPRHREPRFRGKLKAGVARWRKLFDAAMTKDTLRENGSHLATAFVGRQVASGWYSVIRHESAPTPGGIVNVDARCVHPWVTYAVCRRRCALIRKME